MPKLSNRKVNSTANGNYSRWTVTHNLNTPLSNLIVQYYIVVTTAKGNYAVGDVLISQELSYVGSTATSSFGWSTFSIDDNSFYVKMTDDGYGSFPNKTTAALVTFEYNEADLYCNIISVGNNLISQVQTSIASTRYSLGESNTNFLMKNT